MGSQTGRDHLPLRLRTSDSLRRAMGRRESRTGHMMLREATPAMWSARKFDPADYEAITPPLEAERAQYVEGGGHGLAVAGPAVTFVNEVGAPIACMGIVLGQEGTGYAWAYVSREARSH